MRADENFTRAYEKYSDTVYRIAFLILKNSTEAEDILQNVFLKLLKTKKSFESDDHLKAWLIVSAKNASKDILKAFGGKMYLQTKQRFIKYRRIYIQRAFIMPLWGLKISIKYRFIFIILKGIKRRK